MPAQTVIKLRRDTAANWETADSVLAAGELGIETDTNKIKIGDGATEWTGLKYGPISDNLHIRVKNASGSVAIPAGRLVQFAGAAGDTVTASPAVTDGSVDFHTLIGVTASEIAADGFGDVVLTGVVGGVDTSSYTVGTLLYPDDANPGQLTDTAPTAPSFGEPVAAVTRSGAGTSGLLLVRVHLGASLSDIHDINLTSLTNGQVLSYDSVSGTWKNSTIDLSGYATETYANQAETDAIASSNSYTDSLIGDVTVDGTAGNTVTDRIASEVAGLVDSAPTTLDTLNELAAALGDDPNFATTVASSIAGKADASHTHAISDVTNLQTELNSKASTGKAIAMAIVFG